MRQILTSIAVSITALSGLLVPPAHAATPTQPKILQISAGDNDVCVLMSDGTPRCWGNTHFQLPPISQGNVSELSVNGTHVCMILKSSSEVVCVGSNNYGELNVPSGLGTVVKVATGSTFSCAINTLGSSRCWGYMQGNFSSFYTFANVSQISAGGIHLCETNTRGGVQCWGNDIEQGAGLFPTIEGSAVALNANGGHVCVINEVQKLTCWSHNEYGQSSVPADIGAVTQVSTGWAHTCVINTSATVRCWGYNYWGNTDVPNDLGAVTAISAGPSFTCAITRLQTVRCWGSRDAERQNIPEDLKVPVYQDFATTSVPTILGLHQVGARLMASIERWAPEVPFSFQWLRDGLDIGAANSNSYTTTLSDAGHAISVKVTGSLEGYQSASLVSNSLTVSTPLSEMGSKNWPKVSSSADGTKLAAIAGDHTIWTSSDSGANWIQRTGAGITSNGQVLAAGTRIWERVASSADGTKLAAVVYNGNVWTSSDSGQTWVEHPSSGSRYWSDIASSSDGTKLVALAYPGGIWTSDDSGQTWVERTSAGYRDWGAVATSADGSTIVASWNNGNISVSHDSGATWNINYIPSNYGWWRALASSSDGSRLYGVEWCGGLWESKDSGATWTKNSEFPNKTWYSVAVNADGTKIVAGSWADGCWGQPTDGRLTLGTSLNSFSQTEPATTLGANNVGAYLRTNTGSYPRGTVLSYQWLRDGIEISGETSSKFLVRAQDLDHLISFQVTAIKSGYETQISRSSAITIVKKTFTRLVKPQVTGAYRVDSTLRTALTPMGTGVNYTYQWLRDGLPIVGATARTYSIDQSDLGSKITFRVCGSKELHQTACLVSETSNIIALGQFVKSPAIRISLKSYKLGSVIQGLPGVWDSGVTLTYSWLRDGIPIFGETAATYAINQADQGHEITFRVIAQKPGYQDAIKESAARKIS